MMAPAGTVPGVAGEREGQKLITFWLPDAEHADARRAAEELGTTVTAECRKALKNMVKRAERKKEAGQ